MENLEDNKKIDKSQTLTLNNRNYLVVSGTNKVISLKTDLIQLDTNFGGLSISGQNLELIKLDNANFKAEISGTINSIKYLDKSEKIPFFRKLFK